MRYKVSAPPVFFLFLFHQMTKITTNRKKTSFARRTGSDNNFFPPIFVSIGFRQKFGVYVNDWIVSFYILSTNAQNNPIYLLGPVSSYHGAMVPWAVNLAGNWNVLATVRRLSAYCLFSSYYSMILIYFQNCHEAIETIGIQHTSIVYLCTLQIYFHFR